ncbi:hypothetical protein KW791_02070 [Candidatus Parcubacteria bacterium]|nr:hypothetical protein [Candidatus Parcubacteria bacterium]
MEKFDDFAKFRERMYELRKRSFLMRVNKTEPIYKHITEITVCDGVKHRVIETGTWDNMIEKSDCDGKHDNFEEKTGQEINDIVPNLEPDWLTDKE